MYCVDPSIATAVGSNGRQDHAHVSANACAGGRLQTASFRCMDEVLVYVQLVYGLGTSRKGLIWLAAGATGSTILPSSFAVAGDASCGASGPKHVRRGH